MLATCRNHWCKHTADRVELLVPSALPLALVSTDQQHCMINKLVFETSVKQPDVFVMKVADPYRHHMQMECVMTLVSGAIGSLSLCCN